MRLMIDARKSHSTCEALDAGVEEGPITPNAQSRRPTQGPLDAMHAYEHVTVATFCTGPAVVRPWYVWYKRQQHQKIKKKFQYCVIWAVFFQFCVMRPIAKKARKSGLNLERYPRIKIQRTSFPHRCADSDLSAAALNKKRRPIHFLPRPATGTRTGEESFSLLTTPTSIQRVFLFWSGRTLLIYG